MLLRLKVRGRQVFVSTSQWRFSGLGLHGAPGPAFPLGSLAEPVVGLESAQGRWYEELAGGRVSRALVHLTARDKLSLSG